MKTFGRMSLWSAGVVAVAMGLGAAPARGAEPYAPPMAVEPNTQPAPAMTDAAITSTIQAKMEESVLLRKAQITIATKDGVVTLVGTIPSNFARDEALDAVRSTPGVVRFDDHLRLDIASPQAPTRN
jgi:hyperosmotically inducible protein